MPAKKTDDMDFEIAFYEGILQKRQNFEQVLMALGDLYTKRGMFQKGLGIDKKLCVLRPKDPTILYNLACSYSLLCDFDKAFSLLKKAVECGYDDFDFLMEDSDLDNLRNEARFPEFIAPYIKH